MHARLHSLALVLVAAAGAAHAMPKAFSPLDAGMLVPGADGARTVTIGADTRFVNVVNGETVNFTVSGKSFTYAFNAWNSIGAIDLSAIAPKDLKAPPVRVYIAPNPLGQG